MASLGGYVARFEGKFTPAEEAEPSLAELLAAMSAQGGVTATDRQQAIACVLSASEGWREALALLGGAFAGDGATGLRTDKDG